MMKKLLVCLVMIVLTACSSTQSDKESKEEKIPAAVKESFVKKYPNTKNVDWEEDEGNFEAEFKVDHMNFSIVFDPAGKVVEEEMEIAVSELPETISEFVMENYKGKKITEAAKITTVAGTIEYEAEVDGEDLFFDSNGKFISLY